MIPRAPKPGLRGCILRFFLLLLVEKVVFLLFLLFNEYTQQQAAAAAPRLLYMLIQLHFEHTHRNDYTLVAFQINQQADF